MKRLFTVLGVMLTFVMSVSLICSAAEQVGSDTLADWDLEVPSFANTMSVLDGEDGNYYIYPSGERGIPYVMIHAYEGFDSAEDFLTEFTDSVMLPNYPDLEILYDIYPVEMNGTDFCEIDYVYSINNNLCYDRRVARTVGDLTYMFASKEVPDLDLVVGDLLEDTIDGCVFLAEEDAAPVPETIPDDIDLPDDVELSEDTEIPELLWPEGIEEDLAEDGITGDFYVFDEVDAKIWIPDFMEALPLTQQDRDDGYIAYFTNEDSSMQIGVEYNELSLSPDEFREFLEGLPQVDSIRDVTINGIPFLIYSIPETDVMVLSTITNSGYVMEFSFFPASDGELLDFADIIGVSIQPE